jgi:predicted dehydrogenase
MLPDPKLIADASAPNASPGRRRFLAQAGSGLFAATLLGGWASPRAFAQRAGRGPIDKDLHLRSDLLPIELTNLTHATEQQGGSLPAPQAPDKRVGFAIVGLGTLALGQILPAFASSAYARPVALVSSSPTKARKVARQYGIPEQSVYSYDTFDQLRDNPAVDVIYIVLPNAMHEEFTVRAARAGKHVLCEKPMATSPEAAQRMITACAQAGKHLMIAYRMQYDAHTQLAQQWARAKRFGNIKLIDANITFHYGEPTQWRLNKQLAGGGALPDVGLYCLNTIRYLLGEEPEEVMATTYSTPGDARFREVEETMLFWLKFPSGTLANCSTSYGLHKARRYRCHGDQGGWFGMDPAFDFSRLHLEASHAAGNQEIRENPVVAEHNQFAAELDHMARCVVENKRPYTPGEEGLQDQKIMAALYESARTQRPVKLARITQLDAFRGTPPAALKIV